jgi:hypothetical protein
MYGRRHLVEAFLGAQDRGFGGYYPDSSSYNAALKAYHVAMLDGLQHLFDLRLDAPDHRALFMLLRSATDSFLAVQTPWSGFLEAGLLIKKVEEAGDEGQRVMALSQRIETLATESRQVHLDLLDALVAIMLADRAELTFDSTDLHAIGINDTKPTASEYPLYED